MAKKLFVGNLSFTIAEEQLTAIFSPFGNNNILADCLSNFLPLGIESKAIAQDIIDFQL